MEGWKCITNNPFVSSIVAKGYRLRFTSPPLLLQTPSEIQFPQGTKKIQGMREQVSLMLQRNAISEISPDTPGFCSNCIHGMQGIWSYRLKTTEPPHRCSSLSNAHHKLSAEYCRKKGDYTLKIDLQDAYFHVLIHPHSRKYLRFAFENKVYQFRVLHFSLNTAPQVFTCLRHGVAAYRISSQKTLSYREVYQFMGSLNWASGLIPLGHLHLTPLQHFHSLGLINRFSTPRRSDPVVLATLLRQWQNLSFLTSGIPI